MVVSVTASPSSRRQNVSNTSSAHKLTGLTRTYQASCLGRLEADSRSLTMRQFLVPLLRGLVVWLRCLAVGFLS